MSKSKEEIVRQYRDDSKFPGMKDVIYVQSDVLEAMDEYAASQSMAFTEFVQKKYHPFMASGRYMKQLNLKEIDEWPDLTTIETFSISDLYSIFLEHQNKQP